MTTRHRHIAQRSAVAGLLAASLCLLCVVVVRRAPAGPGDDLAAALAQLEQAVRRDDRGAAFEAATEIARLDDPRAIPSLIGLIDSDNSYTTIYGIGWFALGPLAGVRYDADHHGPWWRRWWQANAGRFPPELRELPIPDYPRTDAGRRFAEHPPDPATIILEPTLDELLERLGREVRQRDIGRIFGTARWIAEFENPRAIPVLVGLIEQDDGYNTIYGIGWFGLGPLTGVQYDRQHDGAWWRQWWRDNEASYAARIDPGAEPPGGNLHVPGHLKPAPDAEDVADVPARDLRAGGNPDMRYLLVGASEGSQPPDEGYRLLIVMPGGNGGPDFHPFIKRIYKAALPGGYLLAQIVAPEWSAGQARRLVWPTRENPWPGMKFSTEAFVDAVIADIGRTHKLDERYIFQLAWSSSGPAAYTISLEPDTRITGSYVAMSVFTPEGLPPLEAAGGRAYFILHSPGDFIPIAMAEAARDQLTAAGASVELVTYEGGHGWHGDVYGNLRRGIIWLEAQAAR